MLLTARRRMIRDRHRVNSVGTSRLLTIFGISAPFLTAAGYSMTYAFGALKDFGFRCTSRSCRIATTIPDVPGVTST